MKPTDREEEELRRLFPAVYTPPAASPAAARATLLLRIAEAGMALERAQHRNMGVLVDAQGIEWVRLTDLSPIYEDVAEARALLSGPAAPVRP